MAMAYATITGKVRIPGTEIGIPGELRFTPRNANGVLPFPSEDITTIGYAATQIAEDGTLELLIPTDVEEGLLWRVTFHPKGLGKLPIHLGDFPVTEDVSLADLLSSGTGIPPVDPDDIGFDIILVAGQSNMAGQNDGFDPEVDTTSPRIKQWPGNTGSPSYGQVITAVDPLVNRSVTPNSVGPAMAFARAYIETVPSNRSVLLVPVAQGSTGFTTTPSWKADGTGTLYEHAVDRVLTALALDPNNRVKAVLWVQGESDVSLSQSAYAAQLDALIEGLRADLDTPDLPFVIGQMVPEWIAGAGGSAAAAINAAHAATPSRLTYTGYAAGPTGKYVPADDNIHYNVAGARDLGQRMFDTYLDALSNVGSDGLLASDVGADPLYAWSVRQVVTDYAGPCLRVRRSSDNTEQDIGFASGAIDTTALLAFAGSGSAYVTKWYNQGTAGATGDVVQATAANQPRIVNAGTAETRNGKTMPFFDGSNDRLFVNPGSNAITAAAAATCLMVVSTMKDVTVPFAEGDSVSGAAWIPQFPEDGHGQYLLIPGSGGTTVKKTTTQTYTDDNSLHQDTTVDTGTAITLRKDGAATSVTASAYTRSGTFTANPGLSVGGFTSVGFFHEGWIGEVAIWTTALGSTAYAAGEDNEQAFYATP